MTIWLNLFRQEEEGNKPLYSNNKVKVEQDFTLKAGTNYQVALWKKTETATGKQVDMVSIKVEENTFSIEAKETPPQKEPINKTDDIPF